MKQRATAVPSIRLIRRKSWWVAFASSVALLAAGVTITARGEGGEPRYFAITHARVVPVSGPVIEDGTVVVARGLIQAVGTSVTIPAEAWVIEGKGLTVYPGFIDAGTSVGLSTEDNGGQGGGRGRGAAG